METFLRDLEPKLAKLSPADRAEVIAGLRMILEGVGKLGGRVRPSLRATLAIMRALMFAMSSGTPIKTVVARTKAKAASIGPHVDSLLRAF